MSTSTLTPRAQFREVVASIADKARAKLPECAGRIDSAVKLVLLDEVTLHADGTATVGSCTDPTKAYTVNGTCTCKDYSQAPGLLCKHRLAYGIARRVQELLPPAPEPEPQATVAAPVAPEPLPEARCSVNCHVMVAGRQVQVTLRGTSEAEVLRRLETVLQTYPDVPAASAKKGIKSSGETSDTGEPGWCHRHNTAMRFNEGRDGRKGWWSHNIEGTWCKGK
jgi:hypothetical protein